jgi:hypothetical protein
MIIRNQEIILKKTYFAIASLVVGILSLIASFIDLGTTGILLGILGIILGILGYKSERRGLAIAGILLSAIPFILFAIVVIIAYA